MILLNQWIPPWSRSRNQEYLTHWGRVTHICVGKTIIIGSDNGLSPSRRQAIIWTNAGILLIGPQGTNPNVILNSDIFFQENGIESVVCEMAAILSRPQCVNHHYPHSQKETKQSCVTRMLCLRFIIFVVGLGVFCSNNAAPVTCNICTTLMGRFIQTHATWV